MTKIVFSRDRKLLLIDGVRHSAVGARHVCRSGSCAVMAARVRAVQANDLEDHYRICELCCDGENCLGAVTASEAT
jgi:hypothetical protein